MRFSERFEYFLQTYRKPDGSQWTPAEIEEATNYFVKESYISSLRSGRIRKPGTDRLKSIARVMGFPWQLWYEDPENWDRLVKPQTGSGKDFAQLLNQLFDVLENFRTEKPYTNAEVAELSGGRLTEEEVRALRSGELQDPTMEQLIALSDVFGVDPAYWFAPYSDKAPLDQQTMLALTDPEAQHILAKTFGLSEQDRSMISAMLERLSRRKDQGE